MKWYVEKAEVKNMKFDILKTLIMTAFAGATPKNLELTCNTEESVICHSKGTNVTEESLACHSEERINNEALDVLYSGSLHGSTNKKEILKETLWETIHFSRNQKISEKVVKQVQGDVQVLCKKCAFTLAETMIVLVILGIVAAITIPALVRRHVEASNRTRIKKAMTVYDTALNKMVVENGIKNNDALINEFNADKNNNSCAKSRAYFKSAQDGANDCTFRASDGVWWNISDINHPIIAFNEDDLNKADEENNKAFHLVGYLDDNGSLRVSDLAQATGDNQEYLTKLYNFVNNKKETSSGGGEEKPKSFLDNCVKIDDTHYNCDGDMFVPKKGDGSCVYIPEGPLEGTQSCGTDKTVWVPENPIKPNIYGADADSDENCATSTYKWCQAVGDYYNAAKRYCESKGTHLATVGELISLGYTDGIIWAAEEYDSSFAYDLWDGGVNYGDKSNGGDVVCVGN